METVEGSAHNVNNFPDAFLYDNHLTLTCDIHALCGFPCCHIACSKDTYGVPYVEPHGAVVNEFD